MGRSKVTTAPVSESELLRIIRPFLPEPSRDVLAGIGDDCAVIRMPRRGSSLHLLKTDAVIEGVHYASGTPLTQVGWKALCRPLSDIAAMGGIPGKALITVAAPSAWSRGDWKNLYRGIGKAARAFGVDVVGGESVRSPGAAFLSVTLTGEVSRRNLRLRNGARPGDLICVTGKLGGSLASGRHLKFRPRLREGLWLGNQSGVTAMMDLSDGLGSDLPKLAEASACSFRVAEGSLPLHRNCTAKQGMSDGEDYELLVTVKPKSWPVLQRNWISAHPELLLTPVGVVLPRGEKSSLLAPGFDHFDPGTR